MQQVGQVDELFFILKGTGKCRVGDWLWLKKNQSAVNPTTSKQSDYDLKYQHYSTNCPFLRSSDFTKG